MSMSKKDFIALADALRELKPTKGSERQSAYGRGHDSGRFSEYETVLEQLADFCKSRNSRFLRDRWLGYIKGENGPNGGKVK